MLSTNRKGIKVYVNLFRLLKKNFNEALRRVIDNLLYIWSPVPNAYSLSEMTAYRALTSADSGKLLFFLANALKAHKWQLIAIDETSVWAVYLQRSEVTHLSPGKVLLGVVLDYSIRVVSSM